MEALIPYSLHSEIINDSKVGHLTVAKKWQMNEQNTQIKHELLTDFKKVTKKPINKPDSAEQAGASQGRRKYPYTFQHLGWKYRKTDLS